MRGPVEPGQYTSSDYTQTLSDHVVLASIGTVGDAYDNALAESFVDSYKTELISDRVWRSHVQVELATVEWVAWFNHDRLHESLGDIPPVEFEQLHAAQIAIAADPGSGSLPALSPNGVNGPTTSRFSTPGVDFVVEGSLSSANAPVALTGSAQAATTAVKGRTSSAWPRRSPVNRHTR